MSYLPKRLVTVNGTRKGERLNIGGENVGGAGVDGRNQYVIAFKPYNPKTGVPGYYTCGCGAWKFQGWRKKGLERPQNCKHIMAMLARKAGVEVTGGATIREEHN